MPPSETPSHSPSRPDRDPVPIGDAVEELLEQYQTRLRRSPPNTQHSSASPAEQGERQPTAVELGDIVKLSKPYLIRSKLYGQEGTAFTHGIVAEILSRLPNGHTRTVSLYLYNPETRQIYIGPNGIPEFVDHGCLDFSLWKRATEMGYSPTDPNTPPDEDA